MRSLITTCVLFIGLAVSAQNYSDLTEILRSDVRTGKEAIVLKNLGLTDAQSAAFTPIYDAYSAEMKTNWDKRIQLIKDYAAQYETMNDNAASSLMKRNMDLDKDNLSIRAKYAKKMAKVLPTTITARWMQIESRLNKMIDLQIANQIPLMPANQ